MYRKGSRYNGYFKNRGNWNVDQSFFVIGECKFYEYKIKTNSNLKWCSITKLTLKGNTHLVKRLSKKDRDWIKNKNNVGFLVKYVNEFESNINEKSRKVVFLGDDTYIYDGKK